MRTTRTNKYRKNSIYEAMRLMTLERHKLVETMLLAEVSLLASDVQKVTKEVAKQIDKHIMKINLLALDISHKVVVE